MATYTTRTIMAALLVGALATPLVGGPEATAEIAPIFSSAADEEAYLWTRDLLSGNGFEYPTVQIEFHRTEESCGGMRGRTHFSADQEFATIHVCATHRKPHVEDAWRRRTLLHEVAHAWIDQNGSEEQITAFMELRETATWWARDQAWQDRGAEHAAEIFMWGIQDGDYKVDLRIDRTECSDLSPAYELLTGTTIDCGFGSI